MQTQKMPLNLLSPAEYNPRKDLAPGDATYDKLKRSIEAFGCVEPIIWNKRTGNVVGGHQRLKILLDLGYTEDDVIVVDVDEIREKELNLSLNNIRNENDGELLTALLAELKEKGDLSLTGFDEAEIDRMLAGMNLDIDSFFAEKDEKADSPEEHKGEIQCPHCGEWFKK